MTNRTNFLQQKDQQIKKIKIIVSDESQCLESDFQSQTSFLKRKDEDYFDQKKNQNQKSAKFLFQQTESFQLIQPQKNTIKYDQCDAQKFCRSTLQPEYHNCPDLAWSFFPLVTINQHQALIQQKNTLNRKSLTVNCNQIKIKLKDSKNVLKVNVLQHLNKMKIYLDSMKQKIEKGLCKTFEYIILQKSLIIQQLEDTNKQLLKKLKICESQIAKLHCICNKKTQIIKLIQAQLKQKEEEISNQVKANKDLLYQNSILKHQLQLLKNKYLTQQIRIMQSLHNQKLRRQKSIDQFEMKRKSNLKSTSLLLKHQEKKIFEPQYCLQKTQQFGQKNVTFK